MRTFVKAVMATAVLSGISMGYVAGSDAAVSAQRNFAAGKYELTIAGKPSGFISAVAGGSAVGEVVQEKLGVDRIVHKHLGSVKYEEIVARAGTGMSKEFYDWIRDTLDHKPAATIRKDGAVVYGDYDGNVISELKFRNAFLAEIGFPALDAASKDQAYLTVSFAPELTQRMKGSGKVAPASELGQKSKRWLPANFRLSLQDIDDRTTMSRVNSIEAITIKQKLTQGTIGEHREYEQEPGSLEIPNLVFTLAESHAQPLYDWHKSFVIDGMNAQDKEKTATLEYLAPDAKTVYFRLDLLGVGIVRVAPIETTSTEQVRRVKVTCYVEQIRFSHIGAAGN